MPNIAITSYCNLHCPYCFAQQMFQDNNIKNMSIERFNEILQWIEPYAKDGHCRIGIIGGEPTLNPNFESIMEYTNNFCNKYNCSSILFTNGIKLTSDLIKVIPDKMRILLNYNTPSIYRPEDLEQLHKNIQLLADLGWLYNKMSLGLTMCERINDYSYFKEIIKKYNLKHFRLGIDKANGNLNQDYIFTMKEKFLDIIDFSIAQELESINIECRIPLKYFSENEQKKIFQLIPKEQYNRNCQPSFEIFSDFTMTGCFAHYQQINCKNYDNFKTFIQSSSLIGGYSNE